MVWRHSTQARVPSLLIVEHQPIADVLLGLSDTVVGLEVNLLVFQAAPVALNKNIIHPTALAVHADFDAVILQRAREIFTGKLTALITVEYIRYAVVCQRFFRRPRSGVHFSPQLLSFFVFLSGCGLAIVSHWSVTKVNVYLNDFVFLC